MRGRERESLKEGRYSIGNQLYEPIICMINDSFLFNWCQLFSVQLRKKPSEIKQKDQYFAQQSSIIMTISKTANTLSLLLFVCTNFSIFEILGFWRY